MSEAGATRQHQTISAWVLSQGACQACFEEPLLWKNVVQRGLCSTGRRSPTSMWVRSALQQPLVCIWSRQNSCSPFPVLLPTAAPQGSGLASPRSRQLQGPHSAVNVKDRCLPPAQPSPFWIVLPSECPLNLLSHPPNSSHVHSPLQNKRFEMKGQSCSNNHIKYLFRWDKRWVKSSFSDIEESENLLVSTAKSIFPTGLVFHKVTWSKSVCTHDQVWLKTKQQHCTWHCLVCRI